MHFQKTRKRTAFVLCALLLSFNLLSAYPMQAHASTITHANMYKVVDMALSKTGIVANNDIINTVSNSVFNHFTELLETYSAWLTENGYEVTVDTFNEWIETTADKTSIVYDLIRTAIEKGYDILKLTLQDIADIIVGADKETGITTGIGYKISDKAVEYIRDRFNEYAETEADFYYIDTVSPDDVHPGWFKTKASYDCFVTLLSGSEYIMYLSSDNFAQSGMFSTGSDNEVQFNGLQVGYYYNGLHLVHYDTEHSYDYYVYCYDDGWEVAKYKMIWNGGCEYFAYSSYEDVNESYTSKGTVDKTFSTLNCSCTSSAKIGICTNDGRQLKVFKDVSTMKLYNVGKQSYYLNQSNDYSTTNDNSIDFTGTYYENNSDTYSYDVVQNEIDNSTEINEETVNNIVNTTTTTIVNNYYGSASGDGGENGDGENTDSPTDYDDEYVRAEISGLGGALIGIAFEHFDTLHDVAVTVRDGMESVTEPINDITDIVGGTIENVNNTAEELSTELKDTGGFMAELYSFIPEEYMNLLILSGCTAIAIALWNRFTG